MAKKSDLNKVSLILTDRHLRELARIAERTGHKRHYLMRQAIDHFLFAENALAPKQSHIA